VQHTRTTVESFALPIDSRKSAPRRRGDRRTANLLAALIVECADRLERQGRIHPNETSSCAAALNVIGADAGCSNAALSRALGLSHTATVRLVDKLEAIGDVVSEVGAKDKRSVALRLTDQGRARAHGIVRARGSLVEAVTAVLSPAELRQLDDILDRLLKSMVEEAEDAWRICRLCDFEACPPERCPVHTEAVRLGAA
jgi:MarR family transcriptional regulator, negative regulator of the multidrug operon emrRAB